MASIRYNPEEDAAYISFRDRVPVAFTKNLDGSRLIDYDANGEPIGVELLDVSEGVNLEFLPRQEMIVALLEQQHIPVFA